MAKKTTARQAKTKTTGKRAGTAKPRASVKRPAAKPSAAKPRVAKPLAAKPLVAKPFHAALKAELESKGASLPELRDIARKAIDQALAGEKEARVFIADRLDGKVSTASARDGSEEQVTVVIKRFAKNRTSG